MGLSSEGDDRTNPYVEKGDSPREQPGWHIHWVMLSGIHTGNITSKVVSTKPGMVAHASNRSMQEVEAGPGLQGHFQLHSVYEASLGYWRPYFNFTNPITLAPSPEIR